MGNREEADIGYLLLRLLLSVMNSLWMVNHFKECVQTAATFWQVRRSRWALTTVLLQTDTFYTERTWKNTTSGGLNILSMQF